MHIFWKTLSIAVIAAAPVAAGALVLEIGNPAANPEAKAKHAVAVARITACRSPEKTTVTASAEGIVDGFRKSIPLKLIPLSSAGSFAVTGEWPEDGAWTVKLTATNPDYPSYATGATIPFENKTVQWAGVKRYYHAPTEADVAAAVEAGRAGRAEVNSH